MTFEECVEGLRGRFLHHDTMDWDPTKSLREALTEGKVPDEPGVYVLSGLKDRDATVVYVGRAGTLRTSGTFKAQKLWGRLQAKQDGMPRPAFFRKKLREGGFTGLRIEWFQTWDEGTHCVPALEEAQLVQAYLDEHGRLPPWNTEF